MISRLIRWLIAITALTPALALAEPIAIAPVFAMRHTTPISMGGSIFPLSSLHILPDVLVSYPRGECPAFATAPVTCAVATEGRCYTDTDDDILYYCNGTDWTAVSTITTPISVANGGTNLTSAADDNTMVGNGTTWQSKAIADCDDSGGNHLNYDTATNEFSCGTSSGSNGANTALSNLASVAINTALLPDAAAADDFGSATLPFKDMFLAGSSGTPGTNNFKLTGASTSGTRVITFPDGTTTLGGLALTQTWAGTNTFGDNIRLNNDKVFLLGTSEVAGYMWNTTQTVDTMYLGLGVTSNHVVIAEAADAAFDFAHDIETNPKQFIHSTTQSTTQWIGMSHDVTDGVIDTGAGDIVLNPAGSDIYVGPRTSATPTAKMIHATDGTGTNIAGANFSFDGGASTGTAAGGNAAMRTSYSGASGTTTNTLVDRVTVCARGVAMTDNVAATVIQAAVPSGSWAMGTVIYGFQITDATDYQAGAGYIHYSCVNKGGVISTDIALDPSKVQVLSAGSNSLTAAMTTAAGVCNVQITNNTTLVPSGTNSMVAYITVFNNSQNTVTCQ